MRFNELLKQYQLGDRVELKGSFCMERCGEGFNWQVDDIPITSTSVEDALAIFGKMVLEPALKQESQ
jgi:hypothetical protein